MIFRSYRPRQPLSEWVESFWYWQSDSVVEALARRLPTSSMEFVINLCEAPFRVYDPDDGDICEQFKSALICGPHSKASISSASQAAIGVHFKPGGAFPFLRVPASELRDAHISFDSLWGKSTTQLREQLLEAERPESMFFILEHFMLQKVARPLAHHPAVALALAEFAKIPQTQPVSAVAKQTGLSQRRFIHLFSEEVGLTPKLFCRIQRFQTVLRLVKKTSPISWASVATSCGYFDQAHLVHEFRAFSGLSPSVYLENRGDDINHVLINS